MPQTTEPSVSILVVQGDESLRPMTVNALERAGYDVHSVRKGNQAIALCKDIEFDLILSDAELPDISGHEVVSRAFSPDRNARTALMDDLHRDCACCPYAIRCPLLTKPFTPRQL